MGIGITIMAIGAIHALFGIVVFPGVWFDILREGFFNTVRENPMRGAVVWFELYALPVLAFGHIIAGLEKRSMPLPSQIKWYLAAILITGVVLMPASGFWLLLIPLFLLWRRSRVDQSRGQSSE